LANATALEPESESEYQMFYIWISSSFMNKLCIYAFGKWFYPKQLRLHWMQSIHFQQQQKILISYYVC